MYVVCVNFELKPDFVDRFMPLIEAQAANSLELERGCERFDVCVDEEDPARVFLYEVYEGRRSFELHLASDHFKAFDAAVAGMVKSKSVGAYRLKK